MNLRAKIKMHNRKLLDRLVIHAYTWIFVGLFATTLGAAPAVLAEPRLALIIANGNYTHEGLLTGPVRDAKVMRDALQRAHFSVSVYYDVTSRAAFYKLLQDFEDQLRLSDHKGIGVLYYAGHGAVDRRRGEVYLIPTAFDSTSSASLAAQALSDSDILDGLESTHAKAVLAIFDACRTRIIVPPQTLMASIPHSDATRSITSSSMPLWATRNGRPLQTSEAPVGVNRTQVTIVYSADPGNIASDDGLFAATLAKAVGEPGATSVSALEETQTYVASHSHQLPRIDIGFGAGFIFTPSAQQLMTSVSQVVYKTNWEDETQRSGGLDRLGELFGDFKNADELQRAEVQGILCDPGVAGAVKQFLRERGVKCIR